MNKELSSYPMVDAQFDRLYECTSTIEFTIKKIRDLKDELAALGEEHKEISSNINNFPDQIRNFGFKELATQAELYISENKQVKKKQGADNE